MNENYKWKNETLYSHGIIIENIPTISKGKKRIDIYEIEGRNGFLSIDKGTYAPFVLSLSCHFNEENFNINDIKNYLDGHGNLCIGTKNENGDLLEYTAVIQNQIDFEKVLTLGFRKFLIQFLCNPISKSTVLESANLLNNEPVGTEDATANSYPVITIKGSGDVSMTFNGKTFYLYALDETKTYTLDCESKIIVDNNGMNVSNKMSGDFPVVLPNENVVTKTGSFTQCLVEWYPAYL